MRIRIKQVKNFAEECEVRSKYGKNTICVYPVMEITLKEKE